MTIEQAYADLQNGLPLRGSGVAFTNGELTIYQSFGIGRAIW